MQGLESTSHATTMIDAYIRSVKIYYNKITNCVYPVFCSKKNSTKPYDKNDIFIASTHNFLTEDEIEVLTNAILELKQS